MWKRCRGKMASLSVLEGCVVCERVDGWGYPAGPRRVSRLCTPISCTGCVVDRRFPQNVPKGLQWSRISRNVYPPRTPMPQATIKPTAGPERGSRARIPRGKAITKRLRQGQRRSSRSAAALQQAVESLNGSTHGGLLLMEPLDLLAGVHDRRVVASAEVSADF